MEMAEKKEAKKQAKEAKQRQKPRKKGRTVDKWKKKQWFNLVAPNEFDRKPLGETVAEKPKNVVGRVITVDLGQLTGQRQKRHISVLFKVEKVEGKNASCQIVGHSISHGFLNRLVRRRMSKIETVQAVECSDKKRLRIKSMALTVKKLSRKQQTAIRKKMIEAIANAAQKKSFGQFSQEIVFGVIASKLFKQLIKIAPLKRVEIIKSKVLEGK